MEHANKLDIESESEYEFVEKQTIALDLCTFKTPPSGAVMSEQCHADCAFSMCNGVERAIHARMLEVAYHESFYQLKRKIIAIDYSKKSLTEKNMEKQALSSVLHNVFELRTDVDKLLFGKGNISQISQKIIDIEIQKFLDSGMTVSELTMNLDNRLKIK